MEKCEEMMYLIILYELKDDDSLRIETCSNVACHLLNWVMLDWRLSKVTVHYGKPRWP